MNVDNFMSKIHIIFEKFVLRFPVYSSDEILNRKVDVIKEFQSNTFLEMQFVMLAIVSTAN